MLGVGERGLFFPVYDEINTNCFSTVSVEMQCLWLQQRETRKET